MNRLDLVEQILTCTNCELHTQCTAPVPMSGNPGPIVAIGEAPGEQEDLQGRPFIGPAGKLIRSLLGEFDFGPVAFTNSACCYPHGTPTADDVAACAQNKWDQVRYLEPTWLLLLGKVALKGVRPELDVKRGRGRPFVHRGYICYGTYHPAAALRNHTYEDALRSDLERFKDIVTAGPDQWESFIPPNCAACSVDAEWFEADSGLGWCRVHLPDREFEAYNERQAQIAKELRDARAESERQRDAGMARVAAAASQSWMDQAWDALVAYLRTHETFFVDDWWAATTIDRPAESRALGPIVQRAAREGLMERTGQFRKSVASNLTEKPIWLSHLYVSDRAQQGTHDE